MYMHVNMADIYKYVHHDLICGYFYILTSCLLLVYIVWYIHYLSFLMIVNFFSSYGMLVSFCILMSLGQYQYMYAYG